jgi:hypothetical protein
VASLPVAIPGTKSHTFDKNKRGRYLEQTEDYESCGIFSEFWQKIVVVQKLIGTEQTIGQWFSFFKKNIFIRKY